MLLTWKLWRVLREPPLMAHTLYRRFVSRQPLSFRLSYDRRIVWLLLWLLVAYLAIKHGVVSLLLMILLIPALGVLAFLLLPVFLPVLTTLLGGFWAASISATVIRERHTHTYDLLCLAPGGGLGANWAIASGCLHRGEAFDALRAAVYAALAIGLMFLGAMILVALLTAAAGTGSAQHLLVPARTLLELVVVLVMFWLHYVQSVVLSALAGIYVPGLWEGRADTPWVALLFFLALQVGSWLLLILLHLLAQPLVSSITPEAGLGYVLVPLAYFVVFVLLREAIILWLWHSITLHLNAHPTERRRLVDAESV